MTRTTELIAIGYWTSTSRGEEDYPNPATLVHPGWELERRTQILEYLKGGATYASWMGFPHCRFGCQAAASDLFLLGTACLTDGRFVWPEGLWHYIEAHDVMLPDAFITHMAAHDFSPAHKMVGPIPTQQTHGSSDTFWLDWASNFGARA